MLSYELFVVEGGYGFKIIEDDHEVLFQDFDPTKEGFIPMTQEVADMLAQKDIEKRNMPQPTPPKIPTKIEELEETNSFLMLELVGTQSKLNDSEQSQADLILELVLKGVI